MTKKFDDLSLEQIRARIAGLEKDLRVLKEMEKLMVTAHELWEQLGGSLTEGFEIVETAPESPRRERQRLRPLTIKSHAEWVMEALSEPRKRWQTAADIQHYVSLQTGEVIPMTSISPLLTNLKNQGRIARVGRQVCLMERAPGKKLEAPAEQTASASEESESQDQNDEFSDLI